jgi:hypothetical protein
MTTSHRDPMTSYEQAEQEADDRFYEERDDRDAAEQEAARKRRRAQWNAKCGCSGPLDLCQCVDVCTFCGHLRIEHDHDYATDTGPSWGGCDMRDCRCKEFEDE